ncbi:MAG: DUF1566 domain-containing protein [Desulfuromonadaceae bacterium]|nr:DUF1566 domain-containing protein [Desulfuromonadaceae bacterium]
MKKSTMVIGMVVVCFMMIAGAAWCENKANIPPNGTLTDTSTGLVWLQNANCFGKKKWNEALSAAASLKSGSCGLSDGSTAGQWRLPTRYELIARQRNQQGFTNVQAYYWSSTTYANGTDSAWYGLMGGDGVSINYKTFNYYVWPVRGR